MFELSVIAAVIVAIVGFVLFFIIVRRMMRFALRVALVGSLLLALVAGALVWWFGASFDNSNSSNSAQPPARTRPAAR